MHKKSQLLSVKLPIKSALFFVAAKLPFKIAGKLSAILTLPANQKPVQVLLDATNFPIVRNIEHFADRRFFFAFRCKANACIRITMSSRTGLAGVIALMVAGCGPVVERTETPEEYATRKRQEDIVRQRRIGLPDDYQDPRYRAPNQP